MQRVIIVILVLAVVFGGAYLLWPKEDGPNGDELKGDPVAKKKKDDDGGPGLKPKKADAPLPSPDPTMLSLKTGARALMIANQKETWSFTVLMVMGSMKDLEYRSWFLNVKKDDDQAGQGRGMAALAAAPDAAYLDNQDVTVLVLDNIDPNAMPMDFWNMTARRIESGRMGLFVRPGYPTGNDGKALSEHPLLSHPVLKELMPVTKAAALRGTPLPGVFAKPQPLAATDPGNRHPATRLITVPEISARAWGKATQGDGALATKFCYPVQETKKDFQVLVECRAGSVLPAVIATLPTSMKRVYWMGNVDFGFRTHYVRDKDSIQKILINHALVWLAGQAPE